MLPPPGLPHASPKSYLFPYICNSSRGSSRSDEFISFNPLRPIVFTFVPIRGLCGSTNLFAAAPPVPLYRLGRFRRAKINARGVPVRCACKATLRHDRKSRAIPWNSSRSLGKHEKARWQRHQSILTQRWARVGMTAANCCIASNRLLTADVLTPNAAFDA